MSEGGSLDTLRLRRAIADLEGLLSAQLLLSHPSPSALSAQLGEQLSTDGAFEVIGEERVMEWRAALSQPELRPTLNESLTRALSSFKGHRLGLYAERLFCALLSVLPGHQLLAHDLQIYARSEGRQTLGALDLLIQSPRGVEHLELTVKFYLKRHVGAGWAEWLGPNERDTMAKKAHRLLSHQLPLSERVEAKERLASLGLPSPTHRVAVYLGRCFEPVTPLGGVLSPLKRAQSVWVRRGQWMAAQNDSAGVTRRWVPRLYPDWLHRDQALLEGATALSAGEVASLPLERGRYLMLSELTEEGEERRRWMLVSDEWGVAHRP